MQFLDGKQNRNKKALNLTWRLGLLQRCSEIKNEENGLLPVNSFNDYSPWADTCSTKTISQIKKHV